MSSRYRPFHLEMKKIFGERIDRITLNAGLTCPNIDGTRAKGGCTFCQDASYLGKSFEEGTSLKEQLRHGIDYVKKRKPSARFFAYFQNGTNTYAPAAHLKMIYDEALSFPEIVGLILATRPDCLEGDILDLLAEMSRRTYLWVELGLQSHKNEVLRRINRGHTVEEFEEAVSQLHACQIQTCVHAILGLPGETTDDCIKKAHYLNRLPIGGVKIHNLVVFKDTVLERQYRAGLYSPMTLHEYAHCCVDFIENLRPNILVHRLNAHGPRSVTVAPEWSINKMATMNGIHDALEKRDTWQGKKVKFQ